MFVTNDIRRSEQKFYLHFCSCYDDLCPLHVPLTKLYSDYSLIENIRFYIVNDNSETLLSIKNKELSSPYSIFKMFSLQTWPYLSFRLTENMTQLVKPTLYIASSNKLNSVCKNININDSN